MKKEKQQIAVGGQAVIEGVMMRGPAHIATALRRKDGTIELCKKEFTSVTKKIKVFGLPIVRGFVSLIEMMKIGFGTLTLSAKRYELDGEEENKKKSNSREKMEEFFSFAIAMLIAFLLFGFLPYKSAEWLGIKQTMWFNMFAGLVRIVFFVIYLLIISLMKDVKRLFRYHGAEHKAVFAYEQNDELNIKNVAKYSTLHPRCGTSFMFFVMLISILIFSLVDTAIIMTMQTKIPVIFYEKDGIMQIITLYRLGIHFLLLPLISGISFEVLKLSGKKINHPLVKLMTYPGMSLQKITTQAPDDEMLEVAIVALKSAMDIPQDADVNIRIIEDK